MVMILPSAKTLGVILDVQNEEREFGLGKV